MRRAADLLLLYERPDRPGGSPDSGEDAGGPTSSPDRDWDRSIASALDSFDSESDEAAPSVAAAPPPAADPPASIEPPAKPVAAPRLSQQDRDLFAAVAARSPGERVGELGSRARAVARRGIAWATSRKAPARAASTPHQRSVPPRPPPATRRGRSATIAIVLFVAAAAIVWGVRFLGRADGVATTGSMTVTSKPEGASILIDGQPRGTTPATLRIAAGLHTLEVRSAGPTQVASVQVDEGAQLSRYFELAVGTSGATLQVTTKPAGAAVTIDGRARGRAPLSVADLSPGPHYVRVKRGSQSAERLIMLESGANAGVTLAPDAFVSAPTEGHGWLDVSLPCPAEAFEAGRLVGSTRNGPWQLTAGRHELTFVNRALGVQVTKVVEVVAGRTVALEVGVAPGQLSVTATPGAIVSIDGEPLGAAPVARRPLPVGQHDIVARHPVLGERRMSATLIAGVPLAVHLELGR
jgi:hypothetical protein